MLTVALLVAVQKLAPLASQVKANLAGFNSLQELVDKYLDSNRTSSARDM